jgi:hypothetical protein
VGHAEPEFECMCTEGYIGDTCQYRGKLKFEYMCPQLYCMCIEGYIGDACQYRGKLKF